MYEKIRQDVKDSLELYVEAGIRPGGFLTSVLENDLKRAMMSADLRNRQTLYEIVMYVVNELPAISQGSPEKVKGWIEHRGKEGLKTEPVV